MAGNVHQKTLRWHKPWARENKRSFENNEKYKLPMICESKSLKGKTFAADLAVIDRKCEKERREAEHLEQIAGDEVPQS